MSHDKHTESRVNQDTMLLDVGGGWCQSMSRERARRYYLGLVEGYVSPFPDPVVRLHEGIRVVRDDLIIGTKARAGDVYVSKSNADRFVYCQPRTGLAGVSILDVAKRRDRKVTLFMPSSKRISQHQACCVERGADVVFERIAAMPNLNKYAKEWAQENDADFIPLGLRHPLATAGIINAAVTIPEPEVVFVAVSTGVLSRALQIAWPNAKFYGVCVARNLQVGERGEMELFSHPLPFQTPEKPENLPPFPSVPTYDGKVWSFAKAYKEQHPDKDVLMWNVGTDPILSDETIYDRVDSQREWRKKSNLLEIAE